MLELPDRMPDGQPLVLIQGDNRKTQLLIGFERRHRLQRSLLGCFEVPGE